MTQMQSQYSQKRELKNWVQSYVLQTRCGKNVRIRSFSGQNFHAFGLNTERLNTDQKSSEYGDFLRSDNFIKI